MKNIENKKNDDEGGGSSESTETLTNIEMLPDCRIMYPELMKVTDNSFLTALPPSPHDHYHHSLLLLPSLKWALRVVSL